MRPEVQVLPGPPGTSAPPLPDPAGSRSSSGAGAHRGPSSPRHPAHHCGGPRGPGPPPEGRKGRARPLDRGDERARLALNRLTGPATPAGDVAQVAEHRLCKAGVGGSSPPVSTLLDLTRRVLSNMPKTRRVEPLHRPLSPDRAYCAVLCPAKIPSCTGSCRRASVPMKSWTAGRCRVARRTSRVTGYPARPCGQSGAHDARCGEPVFAGAVLVSARARPTPGRVQIPVDRRPGRAAPDSQRGDGWSSVGCDGDTDRRRRARSDRQRSCAAVVLHRRPG